MGTMPQQNLQKLLVVDDEESIRSLVKVFLERENLEIYEAADGLEALSKVSEVHPDFVLLDVNMPNLNGLEALAKLRENEATKELPVIFCTALGDRDTVMEAKSLGITDYILKPFTRTILLEKVKKIREYISKKKVRKEKEKLDATLEEVLGQPSAPGSAISDKQGITAEVTKEEVAAVQAQASSSILGPRIVDGYAVEEIPLEQIQAGQVLALPVYFQNKAPFLKEGTVLNEKFIEKLKEKEDELEKKAVTIRKEKI